ncbi:MAG: hypothetical protein BECKG1743E_GA0114224_106981, partial [Candidatus Kentron sp. G]
YGIESRRKNCVYILVLPPMTIQCQYHWLLSLRGGRVTPAREMVLPRLRNINLKPNKSQLFFVGCLINARFGTSSKFCH